MSSYTQAPRAARSVGGRVAALASILMFSSALWACAHSKPAEKPTEAPEYTHHPRVEWKGFTFMAGQKVRIETRAGTFKPVDTGAAVEVEAKPGHVGVVLGGEARKAGGGFAPPPNDPIQILRVRWLPQVWSAQSGESVTLGEFEATIHADYLRTTP
jgi:hypothetical protein